MSETAQPAQICAPSPYGMPPRMGLSCTIDELDLLLAALARAAARLESMAKTAKFGRKHDEQARRMRSLRMRILRHKMGKPA